MDVFPQNVNILIPIWSVLFMSKTKEMAKLMCCYGCQIAA